MLPLDGLLSQYGEVWFKVQNFDTSNNMTLAVPYEYIHSPYFSMHMPISSMGDPDNPAVTIFVDKGATSDWTEAGFMLDSLNHGTWNFGPVKSKLGENFSVGSNYQITIGIKQNPFDKSAKPVIVPLENGVFDARQHDTTVEVDASVRGTKRVRHVGADFLEILDQLKQQGEVPGKPTKLTPIYAGIFDRTHLGASGGGCGDACSVNDSSYPPKFAEWLGYYCSNPDCLDGGAVGGAQLGKTVFSLGDEISMTGPADNAGFAVYLQTAGVTLAAVGCESWVNCNMTTLTTMNVSSAMARRYYHSNRYQHDVGIKAWGNKTRAATKDSTYLVGANYPPQIYMNDPRDGSTRCHSYIGRAFQWVRAFREKAMTMPWVSAQTNTTAACPTISQSCNPLPLPSLKALALIWRPSLCHRATQSYVRLTASLLHAERGLGVASTGGFAADHITHDCRHAVGHDVG